MIALASGKLKEAGGAWRSSPPEGRVLQLLNLTQMQHDREGLPHGRCRRGRALVKFASSRDIIEVSPHPQGPVAQLVRALP